MDKLQAIGREIRYVEYKLRRQQQEKKKKKQSRQDWLNGANATTTAPNEAGEVKKTSEFNFNDEQNTGDDGKMVAKGKFETDRPQNRQEEDLQLELALAMSRDDAQQEDEQPVVQTSAPQTSAPQIASLLDFDSAPPVAAAPPPQQQSFSPWGAPAPQAAAPLSVPAQPQWESFTGQVAAPVAAAPPPTAANPWSAPAAPAPVTAVPQETPAWEAFGDSFGQAAAAQVQSAPPTPAASADLFGALAEQAATAPPHPAAAQVDLFGGAMADPNGNEALSLAPAAPMAPPKKSASDFLGGAGASLVNFDNLVSRSKTSAHAGMNPFGGGVQAKANPFQKQGPVSNVLSPGVPINQITSRQQQGFDTMGMAPMQPMQAAQSTHHHASTNNHNAVFGGQSNNLLFGAAPMSGGYQPANKKNPFS